MLARNAEAQQVSGRFLLRVLYKAVIAITSNE